MALATLHRADPLPDAPPEQGVEIEWQDSPEDSLPGEGPAASAENAAGTPPDEAPSIPEQELAEAPAAQPPPEPTPPPPPAPVLAEAPAPMEEPLSPPDAEPIRLPAEPPPPAVVDALPPPAPAEIRTAEAPAASRPPDLPLPPPIPPTAPPPPSAPRRQQPQAPSQTASARQTPAAGPAAAPLDAPTGGSRATGAVSPPGLLDGVRNPEPEYPLINRQRGEQGVVTVLLRISESGQVTEIEVVTTSGHPALDDSARRAVQRWRFRPATRDGVPVAGSIRTAIHFRLR